MTPETPDKGYIVKRRGAIGTARANFSCASKTCKTKQGARVYELPVAATRCPVCGSKRIQRLMSPVNISHGIAKRSDRVLEPEWTRQHNIRTAAKTANKKVAPPFAVPMDQLGARLAGYGLQPLAVSPGTARPSLNVDPVFGGLKRHGMTRVPTDANKKMDNDGLWKSTGGTR